MNHFFLIVFLIAVVEIGCAIAIIQYRNRRIREDKKVEARSNFLSTMSHEIRTPINAVIGMNEMILRESTENSVREYASNIASSGQMLLSLINDILDYSKIDSGKMEIIAVDFRLKNILKDLLNMITPRAKAKGLEFFLDVDENIPSGYIGDEIRIKQILTNLLTNAVKYTPEGTVRLKITKLDENPDTIALLFSVKDSGIGIKSDDLRKITEAFTRFDEEKNAGIEGTGLGLSITSRLLELMNSQLSYTSVPGKGSDFYFILQLPVVDETPIGNIIDNDVEFALGTHTSFVAPHACVLVVDDNEMNLKVVENLLKETKIQVTSLNSGKKAVEYCSHNFYHIIFMDHMMPGLDGVETLHKIKEMGVMSPCCDTPVVALTANAISGFREFYMKNGFDDYLTKPIDVNELYNILLKYIPDDLIVPLSEEETQAIPHQNNTVEIAGQTIDTTNLEPLSTSNINGNLAMKYCSSDMKNYLEILRIYYKSGKEMLDRVKYIPGKLFMANDMNDFAMKAHTLKSTSLTLGISVLSNGFKELEFAAKENNYPVMDEKLPVCRQLFEECISEIELYLMKLNLLPSQTESKGSGKLDPEIAEQIKKARDAVDNFDYDEALELLNDLL